MWKKFHVVNVPQLEKMVLAQKLRGLRGFGEKGEQNIFQAIEHFKHLYGSGRFQIDVAEDEAQALIDHIRGASGIESVVAAGSLRRGKETIGDIDLLVTMKPGSDKQKDVDRACAHILGYDRIKQKLAQGENKLSVLLRSGIQADVRLLHKENFGAALLYFTGSKEHNIRLRGRANERGWTLNEYALTTLKSVALSPVEPKKRFTPG